VVFWIEGIVFELLRRYQRYIFGVVTFVIIASFSFFGAYSTFDREVGKEDSVVGHTLRGDPIYASEEQALVRFLAKDREDLSGQEAPLNFCNDGVIRYDFLRTQLADLIVDQSFASFQGDSMSIPRTKR